VTTAAPIPHPTPSLPISAPLTPVSTPDHGAQQSGCPACGKPRLRVISAPRPSFVEQCRSCHSTFFSFGSTAAVSHAEQYNVEASYQRYLEVLNASSMTQRYAETLDRLQALLGDTEPPSLFDVGAGGGTFLARARERGFRIAGNEVSQPAVTACREGHGIELVLSDDLRAVAAATGGYDAVTMWCVIAHTDDPVDLLNGVHALLKPGGVLFFCTPRYCAIDRVALLLQRLTGGRFRRIFDRRINKFHRRQYTQRGMESLLRAHHFAPLSVQPAIGYGLKMAAYLESVGVPPAVATPVGRALEKLAARGMLPRNTLNVYARKIDI
jgi:2-polyprenyl-3-methyl-5-hydroxy-6-metoxy-1,4-benzoquinol methylase